MIAVVVKLRFWEAYWSAVFITARMIRKLLYVYGVAFSITIALLLYAWTHPSPNRDWFEMLQNSRPLQWILALPLAYIFLVPLLSTKKLMSNERFKHGMRYVFSSSGIYIVGPVSNAELQWKAIVKVIETKSTFLLFPVVNVAHVLPKRCFADADDIDAMRELLRTNISDAKLSND